MGPLAQAMQEAHDKVRICTVCGNADTSDPCTICCDDRRNSGVIVVVEDVADLWALERAGAIANARYHVLGGRLSPLDGIGPDDLNIRALVDRVAAGGTGEIIIAVNATVEGQTTAHYVTDQLREFGVNVTRLAHGVPVGGELDYLDDGTLAAAMRARTQL
jgi:recombination protein RecR